MDEQYNSSLKTLGRRTAQLITELYERRRPTFTLSEIEDITGLSRAAARSLISKAGRRGLVTRLKPGLYSLIPFELGRATEHVGDPYLLAEELTRSQPHYISHASAFELHRMVTQPNFTIYVSSALYIRSQSIAGYNYRFIHIPGEKIFGLTKIWISKESSVSVSDLERTIIDGLRQPSYVGGISEVAKGLWMRRDSISAETLISYAKRLNVGAVIRRLGYILELYDLAEPAALEPLRQSLSATYQRLDPILPADGPHLARWRLQLNVSPEELRAVRST
jgi:predicted transcriptional regulator of viral defense system